MASAGALYVDVLPDTRFFGMALRTSMNRAVSGSTLKNVGQVATRGLAVGLVAAGAASVKMALDFNQSFTRIDALTNASDAQIKQYRASVMSLAGETAQSPKALADSLYYLASAGLRPAEVLQALEASAKGAAIGLGEASSISKVIISALNAYADSGLTAIQVTDTLTAAVREGSAAPDEYAEALGRILPVASAAKVEFDEVVASLATLSNVGLNVYEGTTAMRGVLQTLVAPTKTASAALAELGLSGQKLREVLADQGLLAAMRLLEQRSGGNLDVMKAIIPNIRALVGELGNVGQAADKVNGIYQRVKDSIGSTNEAMKVTENSPAFQFRKALNDLSLVMLDFGEHVMPQVVSIMQKLAPAAKFAADNVGLLLSAFLGFKGLSWLVPIFGGLTGAVRLLALAFGEAAGPIVLLPQLLEDNFGGPSQEESVAKITDTVNTLVQGFQDGKISLQEFGTAMSAFNSGTHTSIDGLKGVDEETKKWLKHVYAVGDLWDGSVWTQAEDQILGINAAEEKAADTAGKFGPLLRGVPDYYREHGKAAEEASKQIVTASKKEVSAARDILATFGSLSGKQIDLGVLGRESTAQTIKDIAGAWGDLSSEIAGSIGNVFSFFDALNDKKNVSFEKISGSIKKGIASVRAFGRNLRGIAADARAGIPGATELLQHLIDLGPEAGGKLAAGIAEGSKKARRGLERDIGGALKSVSGTANGLTRTLVGGMNRVAAAVLVATGKADSFQDALNQIHDVTATVHLQTDAAYSNLRDFIAWGNSQSIVMDVYTALHGRARASGGPVTAGQTYVVGERGPEMFIPSTSGRIAPRVNGAKATGGQSVGYVMVRGQLTIDQKGHAFIRGLAREEVNDEMAYRGL